MNGLPKEQTPLSEIRPLRAYAVTMSESIDPITGRETGKHEEIIFIERIKGETAYCWNMTEQRAERFPVSFIRFFGRYRADI